MQKKKVAIVGTTGLPAKYGGFETLAHYLTANLNEKFDFTVYCSTKYFDSKGKRKTTFNGSQLCYLPLNANGYQSILYDIISIVHALFYADVILILGVSGSIILPVIKLFSSKKIIINIDGQEWRRQKWNVFTQQFLKFSEMVAVKYADTVITDNAVIKEQVLENYKTDSVLITYGGDHVLKKELNVDACIKYPFIKEKDYAFTVCRIEPENNIQLILEAYSNMPNKKLVIVGLWNHGRFGMQLREEYSVYQHIHLLDPIYDQDELNIIRSNAAVYIHGHSAGGTNPSLVEAMCLGLPIMAFAVAYNKETTMHQALYFNNAAELQQLVKTTSSQKLAAVRIKMLELGITQYSWIHIARSYSNQIEWLTDLSTQELLEELREGSGEGVKLYTTKEQHSSIKK